MEKSKKHQFELEVNYTVQKVNSTLWLQERKEVLHFESGFIYVGIILKLHKESTLKSLSQLPTYCVNNDLLL